MALWKRKKTYWADVTVNGTRYRQSLETTDRREALSKKKELVRNTQACKVAVGPGKAYARLPFEDAAKQYLEGRNGRVRARTLQFEKERLVPLKKHFRGKTLGQITADDIAAYQQSRVGVTGAWQLNATRLRN